MIREIRKKENLGKVPLKKGFAQARDFAHLVAQEIYRQNNPLAQFNLGAHIRKEFKKYTNLYAYIVKNKQSDTMLMDSLQLTEQQGIKAELDFYMNGNNIELRRAYYNLANNIDIKTKTEIYFVNYSQYMILANLHVFVMPIFVRPDFKVDTTLSALEMMKTTIFQGRPMYNTYIADFIPDVRSYYLINAKLFKTYDEFLNDRELGDFSRNLYEVLLKLAKEFEYKLVFPNILFISQLDLSYVPDTSRVYDNYETTRYFVGCNLIEGQVTLDITEGTSLDKAVYKSHLWTKE